MKWPAWMLKTMAKPGKPKTQKSKAKVTKARPTPAMWVGWPMDENFNPNLLDAAHTQMMRKLGR